MVETPLGFPMWLLSIVEYQDYLESMNISQGMKVCSKCDGNGNWVQNQFTYCPPEWTETLINPCSIKQPPLMISDDWTPSGVGVNDPSSDKEIGDSFLPVVEEEKNDIMKYAMIAGVVLVVYVMEKRK